MPDQYIEVEWNGVRTRVPVMGTIGGPPPVTLSSATVLSGCVSIDLNMVGPPVPDADAEYDRDVRGET